MGAVSFFKVKPLQRLVVVIAVRYFSTCLAETVFPAPDSPDIMMDWFCCILIKYSHGIAFKDNSKGRLGKLTGRYSIDLNETGTVPHD